MDVGQRNLLAGVVAGLSLFSAADRARAVSDDVLTISAGASYTGSPVEVTVPEANVSPALTLVLSSPLAASPTDASIWEALDASTGGIHTIHVAPGTGANEVDVDFSWMSMSPQLFDVICSTTVGFAQPGFCAGEGTGPQDLTDLIFPSSAFPNGAPFQVVFQSDAAPVPEPSSLSLTTGGITGFLLLRRRRRRLCLP
jgi:hypothetical protein